jgi:hypothetical protein
MFKTIWLYGLLNLLSTSLATPLLASRQVQIEDPDVQCCETNCHLKNVGDGNMHIDWLHSQVSDNIQCAQTPDCSAGHSESISLTWSINAGINVAFFSGGFSVSESYSHTETVSCPTTPGNVVCIWSKVAHAAYTVTENLDGYPPICQ